MLRETKSTGTSSPDAAPDATPDATPDAAPDATPDATPDAAPDVTPDAAPDAAPVEKVNIQHNNTEYGNTKLIFNGQHMNGNVFDFFSMYLHIQSCIHTCTYTQKTTEEHVFQQTTPTDASPTNVEKVKHNIQNVIIYCIAVFTGQARDTCIQVYY